MFCSLLKPQQLPPQAKVQGILKSECNCELQYAMLQTKTIYFNLKCNDEAVSSHPLLVPVWPLCLVLVPDTLFSPASGEKSSHTCLKAKMIQI